MTARKIMLIRHAEKPTDAAQGVSAAGQQDPEELIVRGWQRSGALARFFAPLSGTPLDPKLAQPQAIYASKVAKHSNSWRPQHTALELSTLINVPLSTDFTKGDEKDLAPKLAGLTIPVLVAWEHQDIPTIVNDIVGNNTLCPQSWPGTRFDVVWVLDRADDTSAWKFHQVPQMLLSGDSPDPIPF